MNNKNYLILAIFFSFMVCGQAQNERIITESSAAPAEDMYIDGLFAEEPEGDKSYTSRVLPYTPLKKVNIPWQKTIWRLVDTREKMNLPWRAEEKPLFNILTELLKNGEITAFKDEKFKEPMTYEEIKGKLVKKELKDAYDAETQTEKVVEVENTLDWRSVNQYRIKEIWYFDKEQSMLKQRIKGIAPIFSEVVEGSDRPIIYPMFWIYYEEARLPLAKYKIISDENDTAPMSWTDLLDNRYFSSIIIKRSNVLDFKVQDYFNQDDEMFNMDQLFESEKIKQELFNFEHDLWEY
jgi:gliding motility associated protien GldN